MRRVFWFAALISIVQLPDGNSALARNKEAADDGTTYLECLQRGKAAAAAQADPRSVKAKVLADCLLLRRGTATVTEALLVLDGETQERARGKVHQMMAADDKKGLGISRQDDAAIFAAYDALEGQLAKAKVEYRMHSDAPVECVLVQSSGDPDVDATECKSMQSCPPLEAGPAANNHPILICMGNEQNKQLLLLAIARAGLGPAAVSGSSNVSNH